MKWVWTVIFLGAVAGALWWLIDPRPDSYFTRVYLAFCVLWFGVQQIAREHKS